MTNLLDSLNSLSDERRDYLLSLLLQGESGRRAHRWHPSKDLIYLGSQAMKAMFGRRYREYRDRLFECVSEDYSAKEGITKAYRFRDEAREVIRGFAALVRPSKPFKARPGDEVRAEAVNVRRLAQMAAEGDTACAALLAKSNATRGNVGVIYQTYRRAGHTTIGRRFAVGVSLQQLPKDVRRYVTGGLNYVEVDIRNCLPTLLEQTIPLDLLWLSELVSNRGEVLAMISRGFGISRQDSKTLILALMGGAAIGGRSWQRITREGGPLSGTGSSGVDQDKALKWCQRFQHDMNRAAFWVAEQAGQPLNDRSRWRWLAKFAQAMEDDVLSACLRYHEKRGEEPSVLIFDGYMVRGCEGVDRVDLEDLSAYVKQQTGFSVSFSQVAIDGEIS